MLDRGIAASCKRDASNKGYGIARKPFNYSTVTDLARFLG